MISAPQPCPCPLNDQPSALRNSPMSANGYLFMVLLESFLKGRCLINDPCRQVHSVHHVADEYDFIVVGAGSAGSIVAGRLSEDNKNKVLLLEAGGEDPIAARVPSLYRAFWKDSRFDWGFRTVPANYCLDQNGKGCYWPRGKGFGGSSLLNGMMYHRGHAADYDYWVKEGAEGWSWEENKPYFARSEGNRQVGTLVSPEYHSTNGTMPIQQFNYQFPFIHDLKAAARESGFPVITDMNDPNTPVGFVVAQAFTEFGQRITPARAYIDTKRHPNLNVKLNALVTKVLFDGNTANGVEYMDENGKMKTVRAKKEVILSAGALKTPHILLLSGVGPKETMTKHNIPLVADLPVGKNLRNHYGLTLYFRMNKLNNTRTLDWSGLTEYLLNYDGPMSCHGATQLAGLLYSSMADRKCKQPDLMYFFNAYYAEYSKTGVVGELVDDKRMNMTVNVVILRPKSIGEMTLNTTDPKDMPLFDPKFFTHDDDMVVMKDGVKYMQKMFSADALKDKLDIELDSEMTKSCANAGELWSDKWIECVARYNTDAQNHQAGTASMGKVIDKELKVYNVKNLRVIDASAMPVQITGNPQGGVMLVAERGVDFIKKDWS